jgi:hypothetical protein
MKMCLGCSDLFGGKESVADNSEAHIFANWVSFVFSASRRTLVLHGLTECSCIGEGYRRSSDFEIVEDTERIAIIYGKICTRYTHI